jgi:hypothetical protein
MQVNKELQFFIDLHIKRPLTQSNYTRSCINTIAFWRWAQSCSKHVQDPNKHIIEEIVHQVDHLPELYEDARSEKYKKWITYLQSSFVSPLGCLDRYIVWLLLIHLCSFLTVICPSISSTIAAGSSIILTIPDAVCTVLCSWWWAEEPPETCRAIYRNK